MLTTGLQRVFEIGWSFRDEPVDPTHSPEYSLVELYQAGADYTTLRATARELITAAARAVLGGTAIRTPAGDAVDLAAEWEVVPFHTALTASLDHTVDPTTSADELRSLAERHQVAVRAGANAEEIEGQTPAEVAPGLGLTPNGVSALAYRAREALRQGYLQAHLAVSQAKLCVPTIEVLGPWTRGGLSKRQAREVEGHLDACTSCRALSAELAEINSSFRIATKASVKLADRNKNTRQPGAHRQCLTIETGRSLLSMKLAG